MLDASPRFERADAERLSAELFGLPGTAAPLPSERDQNFLITPAAAEAPRIVLKVSNAEEDASVLEAQQAALAHLAPRTSLTPRPVPAASGALLHGVQGRDGRRHWIWALTHLPGRPLGAVRRRSPGLYEDWGRAAGELDAALAGFDHRAAHREFYWDLANARHVIDRHRDAMRDSELDPVVRVLVDRFDRATRPLLDALPRGVVHGDLNDFNVLVGDGADIETRDQCVTGVIDFGDMVYSYRVADLAIAIAYAMLDAADALDVAAHVVRGYSRHVPLEDAELSAVFGLAALRLCTSACIAAVQSRQRPDNGYLDVSQSAIRRTLPALAQIPFALAEVMLRDAAGNVPCPAAQQIGAYLRRHRTPSPVLAIDPSREPLVVLDLSVASPLLDGDTAANHEPSLTPRIDAAMRAAGARLAVGRYDEPRLLYVAPAFALGSRPTDPHRTIHIGLDLFAEAGTPVLAPLDGVIHAFADNAAPQDYGPVVILRHATDEGGVFFTLYGHLSRESIADWRLGASVRAGQQIATLGEASENGGWTPHLHLQIISDLMDLDTDFPGVAPAAHRRAWTALCPDPNLVTRIPEDAFSSRARGRGELLADRAARIGGNVSLSYREPVRAVRGWMQYLYDDEGRRYIDAYNNVPHVGHCHPRVVEAGTRQMRVLNTNTRYLNALVTDYAARLLSTLPRELEVCYLVNSASEANELALRLARAATSQRDMIVLEAAYHGNTTSLIDISPYKHHRPGGGGAPAWVHAAPIPDVYRGAYKRSDARAGAKYATHVAELVRDVEAAGRGIAGFIAETCPSVGGQIVFPPDYLASVYEHIRAAGGICIADEVQTGLGRMGTSFWAFEEQRVVPDIVVMGKPLGNGHPIGAVAVTRAIADAFDNGIEFFSTFGGNTVSCAIGLAVLDVVKDEDLQSHAREVGDHLLAGLRALAERHAIIGDVRGSGLFLGVELVRDRETLEPAGAEEAFVAERMRERCVLLGTDGPYHNVVKIRPPMPFSRADADHLVDALDASLAELPESAPA
jgi:4-aminobutyrate aminotransferase-like enzyme/Ser/Thr protein kinase RdoA (MazF antagonist)